MRRFQCGTTMRIRRVVNLLITVAAWATITDLRRKKRANKSVLIFSLQVSPCL
ncbi:unnamed protein product [Larinioides sclopetarius]|uniref:Uncharacterized protein n=1 Tax=Larinioides sclopetarius TaxID=280406 RepID=A0AAV1Z614_9ARAC